MLYGGRRRRGDVAHFAELAIPTLGTKSIQLVVCVVDIVHGPKHDISRGGTKFWEPQLRAGRVAAIGTAPPCETWSIARFADCEGIGQAGWHNRTRPVPLRTAWHPWGRKDLTPREARQVRTANVLLLCTILFATLASFYGTALWIEHPDLGESTFPCTRHPFGSWNL